MNPRPEPADAAAPADRHGPHGSQSLDDRVRELEDQLTTIRHALDNRDTIGMAKGILVAREGVSPDEAFETLKRASQRTNRKLADIAADMVRTAAPAERPPVADRTGARRPGRRPDPPTGWR